MPRNDEEHPEQQPSGPLIPNPLSLNAPSPDPESPAAPWVMVLAGLFGASLAALALQPEGRPSPNKVLAHAVLWVLATAIAGTCSMAIARLLVRRTDRRSFSLDALESAAAWLLLPPLYLLTGLKSPWTLAFAVAVAGVTAVCLRGMIPVGLLEDDPAGSGPLFAQLPPPDSGPGQAFAIAVCLQCAAVLAVRGQLPLASLLAAFAAFVFVWKWLTSLLRARSQSIARPAIRSAAAAVLALLVVVPLLLVTLARLGPVDVGGSVVAHAAAGKRDAGDQDSSRNAYRGVILFAPSKKDLELTTPLTRNPLQSGSRKPLIIPFDGAYWYFQAPHDGPGLHAHIAHGDPVKVSIFSTGWVPLAMQAHQTLAHPVDLRGCAAMQVTVRNGDNRRGRVEMGVLLTDSTLPDKPSLFLGAQPIVSTETNHFAFKAEPVEEDVTFAIPRHPPLRRFDQITVLFFPSLDRATLAARIGIEQFAIDPR
ncbi:MAG TPA: hypothetical protein VHX37_10085 [Acidobacteriaceae bacterium]|nr:hypothetical protein [Acidobacteriaceae bacterium]